jgi:cysteinyl-tRNA synthetase
MRLYNTLTRTIDDIAPLSTFQTTVYTCGPTVYDYAHIGHWFNYVRMDTLIRTLLVAELKPKWVMNITDVGHLVSDADDGEDKLEMGAKREGKTAWEVAEFYTKDFLEGMKLLNILTPDYIVKATDHIQEQIDLIDKLEQKGYTYSIDDGVYYDTSKFEGYTAFARLDLDEQQGSGRVVTNPQKRNQSDFALWKFSPEDHTRDMEWDSPWGKGFPGWHIECSAMSMKYLGDTLDIHTGGIDHVPVHHTNEIAQSEAVTGKRFANHWMHGNHVMVNGEKIAKSTGNGIRLQTITAQGISPAAVRLHILESHYRHQAQFSIENLTSAVNRLKGYQSMADLRFQATDQGISRQTVALAESSITRALMSDLDTPTALAALSVFTSQVLGEGIAAADEDVFTSFLTVIDQLLGLGLLASTDITTDQKELVRNRQKARDTKDWARSDELRAELTKQGLDVRDTASGQVWARN